MTSGFPFAVMTPAGIMGYGYDLSHFWSAIGSAPVEAIIIDGGSTDPGPYLLGTGQPLCSRSAILRDLEPMLEAAFLHKIKVIISSAGGSGTDAQVLEMVSMINEILLKRQWCLRVATIFSSVDKALVQAKLKKDMVHPCGEGPPPLQSQVVDDSDVVVAQIGAERFLDVLRDPSPPDVVVSGRSYDPAPFAAFAMHKGCEPATAWHMGKIMECGALCALPKGKTIVATMHQDSFDLTPVSPLERCTPTSVAAHTFYEKTRPDQLPGPGGILHLDRCCYTQLADNRSVRVQGSVFVASPRYQVKLEGVSRVGFRSVFIGGVRDPILIGQIEDFLEKCKQRALANAANGFKDDEILIHFHVYGRNAVMGQRNDDELHGDAREIGILGEVTAPTQERANAVAGYLRVCVLHAPYPGQVATAGNLALPLNPLESPIGPVFHFSIYHLMDIADEDQRTLFPAKSRLIGDAKHVRTTSMPRKVTPIGVPDPLQSGAQPHSTDSVRSPGPSIAPTITRSSPLKLSKLASIIRSKNAGPFLLTLDVFFNTTEAFDRVRVSGQLDTPSIVRLFSPRKRATADAMVKEDEVNVIVNMFYRPALGWKCTMVRRGRQGSSGERDTFGTQQHAPLLDVVIP